MNTVERKAQLESWVRAFRPELASRPVTELPTTALLEASLSLQVPVRLLLELRRDEPRPAPAPAVPRGFEHCALPKTAIDLRQTSRFIDSAIRADDSSKRTELEDLLFRLEMRSRAYLDALVEAVFEAAEMLAAGTIKRLGGDAEATLSRAYHDANAHLACVL